MKVVILSQEQAEKYCTLNNQLKSVMISIFSTYNKNPNVFITEKNNIKDILSLKFNDTENLDEKYNAINDYQGYLISKFVKKYEREDIDLIIIHCFLGKNRSAGVGAAIYEYLTNKDDFLRDERYVPNMLCYKIVKENLKK